MKFFTLACLHSGAVCTYLLSTTDFTAALSALRSGAWSPLLGALRCGRCTCLAADEALSLFGPATVIGLLVVLVLSSREPATSELLQSLLDSAVLITAQHQVHLGLVRPSADSEDSWVVVADSSADTQAAAVDAYTPEEVSEKAASRESGVEVHRLVTRTMAALTVTLTVLTAESHGATHMRAVFRAGASNAGFVNVQKLFRVTLAGELLRLTSSQLLVLTSMEAATKHSVDDVVATQNSSAEAEAVEKPLVSSGGPETDQESASAPVPSRVAPLINVRNVRLAHESLKKQLKSLLSLADGGGSSKAD